MRAIATGDQSGCLAGLLGAVASASKQDSGSENDKNSHTCCFCFGSHGIGSLDVTALRLVQTQVLAMPVVRVVVPDFILQMDYVPKSCSR